MSKKISGFGLSVLALMALLITAPMALAETVNLKASLKASESVPPNNSPAPTIRPTIWNHYGHTNLVRIASSLRADMIFGKDSQCHCRT